MQSNGRWLRIDPPEIRHGDSVVPAEPAHAVARTPSPLPKSSGMLASEKLPNDRTAGAAFEEEIDFREVATSTTTNAHDPHKWLALHATDLIDRLTEWSDDLGVREANLHAREARWERQARRLRMEFQQTQMDLDEIAEDLNRRTLELVRQQAKMHRDARSIALMAG